MTDCTHTWEPIPENFGKYKCSDCPAKGYRSWSKSKRGAKIEAYKGPANLAPAEPTAMSKELPKRTAPGLTPTERAIYTDV